MATISKLKVGQILYTLTAQKMGNTSVSRKVLHEVKVMEVDPEGAYVVAQWNHNAPRKYRTREVARWKVKKPEPKGTVLGMTTY